MKKSPLLYYGATLIFLAHLENQCNNNYKISDRILVKETQRIDLTNDSHINPLMEQPIARKTRNGDHTIVNQLGITGIIFDRLDFQFFQILRQKNV